MSNLWQIGQQEMIFRQQQRDEAAEAGARRQKGDGGKDGAKKQPAPAAPASRPRRSFLRISGAPEREPNGGKEGDRAAAVSETRPSAAGAKGAEGGSSKAVPKAGGGAKQSAPARAPATPSRPASRSPKKRRKKGR